MFYDFLEMMMSSTSLSPVSATYSPSYAYRERLGDSTVFTPSVSTGLYSENAPFHLSVETCHSLKSRPVAYVVTLLWPTTEHIGVRA